MGAGLDRFIVKPPHNWAGSYGRGDEEALSRRLAPCTFPWFALVVFWNGDVVPCPQDYYGELLLGDLRTGTLSGIWRGDKLDELRRDMARLDVDDREPCSHCDMLNRRTFARIPTANLKAFLKEMF